ncbi:MAG: carboxymuconolactone decarboxylase family protein [Myxococcaceae bacterium]|nr:carboxymuconolactone decarboxylase family protein [Myxococcaceae bacterium]MCI0673276.1 carboxymuconolactone decarboxylase family protein [Myxococcaceae bacterium]
MSAIEAIREKLPDAARDIRLNLQSVLDSQVLSQEQKWGVALACAFAARNEELRTAIQEDAKAAGVPDAVLDDAKAAAVLMGMNNVYYRFRHFMGADKAYNTMPPKLRMQRLAQVATSKADFELLCLAVSAINGCEMCVRSHEQVVLHGGLTDQHVHDAVRIAATVHAAAVALEV